MAFAGCPADVLHNPLRRRFSVYGFLSHLHSLMVTMSQNPPFLKPLNLSIGADAGQGGEYGTADFEGAYQAAIHGEACARQGKRQKREPRVADRSLPGSASLDPSFARHSPAAGKHLRADYPDSSATSRLRPSPGASSLPAGIGASRRRAGISSIPCAACSPGRKMRNS